MEFVIGLIIVLLLSYPLWSDLKGVRLAKESLSPYLLPVFNTIKKVVTFWVSLIPSKARFLIVWIAIIAVILLAAYAGYLYAESQIEPKIVTETQTVTERVEVPVEVPVYVKGDTVVEYVEKESPEDADVEWYSSPSKVVMSYNDEQFEMDTLQNETHKFDKGKLEVQQSSETVLDVTPIVEREVKIAEAETRKQVEDELNEQFQKELKTKKRQARQDGFWTGLGTALLIGAGAALAR